MLLTQSVRHAGPSASAPKVCVASFPSGEEITRAGGNFAVVLTKISWFQPVGVGTYRCCFKISFISLLGLSELGQGQTSSRLLIA